MMNLTQDEGGNTVFIETNLDSLNGTFLNLTHLNAYPEAISINCPAINSECQKETDHH